MSVIFVKGAEIARLRAKEKRARAKEESRVTHDLFISYFSKESDGVFQVLLNLFKSKGFNVFNQKLDLAGQEVSLEEMQKHAKGSSLIIALLSPNYFESKWCRGELEAAKEAGVPIVPVYSGEDYVKKQILGLLDERDDPEKAVAVKAAFVENLLDANNGEHAEQVTQNLQQKIIERFLARPQGELDA